ncbi:10006_t:CDS:2, partial [Funneliformis caledonium]
SEVPANLYDTHLFKESEFHWLSIFNGYLEDEKISFFLLVVRSNKLVLVDMCFQPHRLTLIRCFMVALVSQQAKKLNYRIRRCSTRGMPGVSSMAITDIYGADALKDKVEDTIIRSYVNVHN